MNGTERRYPGVHSGETWKKAKLPVEGADGE